MLSFLVHFFSWYLSVQLLLWSLFVYLKAGLPTFAGCWSNPSCGQSEEHLPIMTLKIVIWVPRWFGCHFSCVVCCCYTRFRVWLLSVLLSQIWPRTLPGKKTLMWDIKMHKNDKNKEFKKLKILLDYASFNLV